MNSIEEIELEIQNQLNERAADVLVAFLISKDFLDSQVIYSPLQKKYIKSLFDYLVVRYEVYSHYKKTKYYEYDDIWSLNHSWKIYSLKDREKFRQIEARSIRKELQFLNIEVPVFRGGLLSIIRRIESLKF